MSRIKFSTKNSTDACAYLHEEWSLEAPKIAMFEILRSLPPIRPTHRVANITDFSVEVRNSENDPYFSRFLYGVSKFSDFLRILQFFDFFSTFFIIIGNHHMLRPWNAWIANSDKKYMELNGAALNIKKQCVTSRKPAFPKDK